MYSNIPVFGNLSWFSGHGHRLVDLPGAPGPLPLGRHHPHEVRPQATCRHIYPSSNNQFQDLPPSIDTVYDRQDRCLKGQRQEEGPS